MRRGRAAREGCEGDQAGTGRRRGTSKKVGRERSKVVGGARLPGVNTYFSYSCWMKGQDS